MTQSALAERGDQSAGDLPSREFIVLMALLMAMTALSIDIMLPSLPDIAATYGVANVNDRQLVVATYMFGLAAGQLVWGPISDRLGRRLPLLTGLLIFAAASLAAPFATSFPMLIAARIGQGFGGAAARTIATAIIRDLYSGRSMARVMSTVMMVFIVVPVFAPAVGQGVAALGSWRTAFHVLFIVGALAVVWSTLRLPETIARSGLKPLPLMAAFRLVVGSPVTVAYGTAAGCMFGCLVTYISSAQQIFVEVFGLGKLFPLAFGGVASAMALASFTNSRFVQRLGMRRLSHTALFVFLANASLLALLCAVTRPPLYVVAPMLALCFYLFGLMQSNFNAIAMQPVGQAAGMASSLLGFSTTAAGAVLGALIARQFDGSLFPLAAGFAVLSACALICVLLVEGTNGLFRGE